MNKLKLSTASDGVFIYLISFLISYALIKSKTISIATTTLLSSLISIIATFAFVYYVSKKGRSKCDSAKRLEYIKAFNMYLYLLPNNEVVKLISTYLTKLEINFEVKNSTIYFGDRTILRFDFSPENTSLTTCINFYKETPKQRNLVILSCGYDDKATQFFSNFDRVKLYLTSDLFTALEKENLLPDLKLISKEKISFNSLIGRFLRRENVKKFFVWGAILILFSTFSYYKILYLLLGTSFLLLSAYLKFLKKQN